ncbi:type IV conjugative transfer system coupling protein TraD [Methylomagnum sp.]
MSAHPIEALLRPPVEFWSALSSGCAAAICAAKPHLLLMPADIGHGAAALLGLFALHRFRQGWRVVRYQRNLKRLKKYALRADQVPCSRRKLFLGMGFRWTQLHTQRLRDTERPWARPYVEPGRLYRFARWTETAWEHHPLLGHAARLLARDAWWNPARPLPPVGGKPALHGVEPDEAEVWMPLADRVGHTLVLGTTRVGKTRLAEVLITQDIARGDVVVVFDPKGDADLMKRVVAESRRAGRENALYVFHLGFPEFSARYNPIGSFSRITEVATRIANQLPAEGNSAAFREFAWRFSNIVARALYAMGRKPTYDLIVRYITRMDALFVEYAKPWLSRVAPGWEVDVAGRMRQINEKDLPMALRGRPREVVAMIQFIEEKRLFDPVADGLLSATKYDKTYFDKITASLLPMMEKLITGQVGGLISPDYEDTADTRPIFDWLDIIKRRGIVYIGLDALSDFTVSSAVGNSMFADFVAVAGHIYKHGAEGGTPDDARTAERPAISIHADEFNELIGAEFIPLVNKSGGAGVQVTAYTQSLADLEARLGVAAKAGQVVDNFNNLVMLRVRSTATAELLTEQLPEVHIHTMTLVSGVTDASDLTLDVDFTSNNQDRINAESAPILTPADIVALPKGQAFCLIEGGQLWKVRFPLPDGGADPALPASVGALAESMKLKYATGDNWWVGAGHG